MSAPGDVESLPTRHAVRVLLLHPACGILLFPTIDPVRPERLPWWELPGGGIEPGESHVDAATRELAEELGLMMTPDQLAETGWTRTVIYPRDDGWWRQFETVLRADLVATEQPPIWSSAGQTAEERAAYGDPRWWLPSEVTRSNERFFPQSLPSRLAACLRGEQIVEDPVVFW